MLKDYEIDDDGVICILSDNPRKKRLRILSTALNLERIPLIGFGTYAVKTPQVIYDAFSVGYRHLDLLAENYNNLQHVKRGLESQWKDLLMGGIISRRPKLLPTSSNNGSCIFNSIAWFFAVCLEWTVEKCQEDTAEACQEDANRKILLKNPRKTPAD